MNDIIAVDVDLTVVDTLTPWLDDFFAATGKRVRNETGAYDLVPEMHQLIHEAGVPYFDPMAFWRRVDLYDDLEPVEGSVKFLETLSKANIVFVSSCIPEHTDSKMRFLKRNFPFMKGFIATHDKHFVDYDILIDDKVEHILNGYEHRPHAKHFLFTGIRADGQPEDRSALDIITGWTNLY